jgi:predicted nucleic acid-binding protein
MRIDLPDMGILVDSSALVYLVEGDPSSPRRRAMEFLVAEAQARGIGLKASTTVWMELLAKPLAEGRAELAARYRALLADSSRIELCVIDVAIAERAASILASLGPAGHRKISEADALHIATALTIGAGAILTNDEAWRSVPGVPRVLLVDELAYEF